MFFFNNRAIEDVRATVGRTNKYTINEDIHIYIIIISIFLPFFYFFSFPFSSKGKTQIYSKEEEVIEVCDDE